MFISKLLQALALLPTIVVGTEHALQTFGGEDKKASVLAAVKTAVGFGEAVAGRDIIDEDAFDEHLGAAIDGVVGMLNESVWKKKAAARGGR